MKTNKKGISLIVLVITIIVMIILAAAIIVTLTNDNIVNRGKEAVSETNLKQVQELAQIGWVEAYMDGARDVDTLTTGVNSKLDESKVNKSKYIITVTTDGVTVELKTNEEDPGEEDDTPEVATLSGVWVFNETVTAPTGELEETELSYTSNSESFKGMKMSTSLVYTYSTVTQTAIVESDEASFVLLADGEFVVSGNIPPPPPEEIASTTTAYSGSWSNAAYRTVDFGTEPQGVSDTFYAWFTANATKNQ